MVLNNNGLPSLEKLGWDAFFAGAFQSLTLENCIPGRVTGQERNRYKVHHHLGECFATLSGRAIFREMPGDIRPTVGDWVALRSVNAGSDALIEAILPRKGKLSRQLAGGRDRFAGGTTGEQVVAANVDTVFIVSGLDNKHNASPRRIERYLALAWSAGASPVIICNKTDVCPDVPAYIAEIEQIALGVPIIPISATQKTGLDGLDEYLTPGKTAAFLGSSGVGKSSIINALLGEELLKVGEVRENDARGRHTTTRRELFFLPRGGMVIDTPGMREIHLWGEEDDISGAFQDIADLAVGCRFRDCLHRKEPGCAVQQAINDGVLDEHRLLNYRKLQREISYQAARQSGKARLEEKTKWKNIAKIQKRYQKDKDNLG
ncbi:MAG: ribosome small subunit-dependent GTPase A [Dehalococcoidales bacterium]|nr:ribosome small subunit-dependent GTPase A [Dehalococcoidales bacterium]